MSARSNGDGTLVVLLIILTAALVLVIGIARTADAPGNELAATARFFADADAARHLELQRQQAETERQRIAAAAEAQQQRIAAQMHAVSAVETTHRWYALMVVLAIAALGYAAWRIAEARSRRPAPVYISHNYLIVSQDDPQFDRLLADRGGAYNADGVPMLNGVIVASIARRITAS